MQKRTQCKGDVRSPSNRKWIATLDYQTVCLMEAVFYIENR